MCKSFFKTYYAPNNAALAIVGDFDPEQAKQMVAKYFGGDSRRPNCRLRPISRSLARKRRKPRHEKIRWPIARRWRFLITCRQRNSPEYFAMGLIDQMLVQGDDSLLYQELVKKRGYTGDISGAINELGNMFNYDGPMLWTASLFHDATVKPDQILTAADAVSNRCAVNP